jgi:hypothetical protein
MLAGTKASEKCEKVVKKIRTVSELIELLPVLNDTQMLLIMVQIEQLKNILTRSSVQK